MKIITRLVFAPKIPEQDRTKFNKIFYGTDQYFLTKITTIKLEIMPDRMDNRKIIGLKNLKIIFKPIGKITKPIIFMATLSFNLREWNSELFVWRITEDANLNFDNLQGYEVEMKFSSLESEKLELFQDQLATIKNSKNFEFNISQFDEFIAIFDFYKKIANELNNDANFPILNHQFNSYYFVPVGEKTIDLTFAKKIYNEEGIISGYKFSKNDFQNLDDEEQEKCTEVFEFEILGDEDDLKKIKVFGANDSLYLSQQAKIFNANSNLIHFELHNLVIESRIIQRPTKQKDKTKSINEKYIILTGSIKNSNFQTLKTMQSQKNKIIWYLNLWDLGQKIKIETIESSIKEILKGTTSNGIELFEYIIGIKPLPNNINPWFKQMNESSKFLNNLDQSQKAAFLMATDGNPVSLIKGPPGTGKTHVIEAIINYLVRERKEKVLVSSQTHIAIDNVLDKLINRSDMIIPQRIANRKSKYDIEHIDKTLFNIWNTNINQFLAKASNQALSSKILTSLKTFKGEKSFNYTGENFKAQVIGVTTTASQTSGKKGYEVLKGFDWLIIDEVSKCPITEVLRYLPYVKRIIMVGDDYQLAPLLEFKKNDVKNFESYDEDKFDQLERIYQESVFASLFDKALKAGRVVQLNNNYRSVKDILRIYNVFYDSQLQNKREATIDKKIIFKENSRLNKTDALFIEVKNGSEMREGTSRYNVQELAATKFFLKQILEEVKNPKEVTIAAIFPYAAQISRFYRQNKNLINQTRETFKSFELNTVDAFQGKEADIVLVNTVVTDSSKQNFLSDFRRINVALSRARDKILIFGNHRTLQKINMQINDKPARCYFKDIIEYISNRNDGIGFIEF